MKKMGLLKSCLFLVLAFPMFGTCAAKGGSAEAPAGGASRFPDVIFFVVDDLNIDIGCYGHPQVQTPNLDKFREQVMVFDRAYVQYPLCNPSRNSFLSGTYPTRNGSWGNRDHLRDTMPDVVTLPELFRKNGYRTISSGKVYHMTDPESWSEISDLRSGGMLPDDLERDDYMPPYGDERKTIGEGRDPSGGKLPWMEWRAVTENEELIFDTMLEKAATNRMNEVAKRDEPFFVAVGFRRPHDPFFAPKRFFDLYPLDSIHVPTTPEDASPIPACAFHTPYKEVFDQLTKQDAKEFIRSYYAGITYMDDLFGGMIDLMKKNGLLENAVIMFAGDNGYMPGDKGWFNKGVLFERACQVPLMIGTPGMKQAGKRCGRVVQFIDLFPTITELCGLENPPDQLQGKSLVPLLNNPESEWNDLAVTYNGHDRSIRDARYRYIEWGGGLSALYDHHNDEDEFYNRVDNPEYRDVLNNMRRKLETLPKRK